MSVIRVGVPESEPEKAEGRSAVFLLLLAAGVYGILFSLRGVEGIVWREWIVYSEAGFLCVGVWYTFYYRKKLFYCLMGMTALAGLGACILSGQELAAQFGRLLACLTGEGHAESGMAVPVTGAVLLMTAVLVLVLAVLEFWIGNHWIVYVLTTGLMLVSPLFGIAVRMESVALLALFQISFWGVHAAAGKKEKRFTGDGGRNLAVRCSAVTGVILAVCLAVSFLGVAPNAEKLYQSVYAAEGFVYRGLRQISGQADEPIVGGAVSGRNNYQTGTPQLEVTVSDLPAETLYLKGFTGSEYTGGEWEYADENELFAAIADLLEWREWESWIGAMYSTMYFTLNAEMVRPDRPEPGTVAIRQANGELYALYYPYYCRWNRQAEMEDGGYAFDYFERGDMNVDWDNLPAAFGRAADWYLAIRDAYETVIQTAYTGVPEELLPRLSELCRENPLNGTEKVTAFIVSVLERGASYTLTPGNAPLNEDVIEYFLFDNHEGYCVHFASAATLIYRLYGIPSRYAAGYALSPDDFEQQEDGTWRAVVTDESAHAWTEIFLEDYGWTPVEVTPADDGSITAVYPGFDGSALREALNGIRLNTGEEDAESSDSEPAESRRGQQASSTGLGSAGDYENLFLVLAAAALELICLLPFVSACRRTWKFCRIERMNSRQIFALLLEMLQSAGVLAGYTGAEDDFAEAFSAAVPCICVQDAAAVQEIVSRAAYSAEEPGQEETARVREIYLRAAENIYENLGKWKRFWFKNIRAYV